MKKLLVMTTVIILTSVSCLNAQAFEKGTNVLSAGVGLGSSLGSYSSSSQMPGLSVNFESGLWEAGSSGVISLGGYVGIKNYRHVYNNPDYKTTYKWNYRIIGLRSAYHYTGLNNEKIDLYGGLMLSYNMISYKWKEVWPSDPEFNESHSTNLTGAAGITGYVGGRYYFSSKAAVYAELGYGVSYLNAGVSLKF